MAIRKDIDDMLNNLKSGKPLESPKKLMLSRFTNGPTVKSTVCPWRICFHR